MRSTILTFAALATTSLSQTTTTDIWVPRPFSTDPAKWSSIHDSLVSEGKIPSTVTAPPWASASWGPGSGPWGPGGPGWGPGGGHGGPGGHHWGGPDGWGPWGSGSWSDLASYWSTNTDWRNGPWTSWWAGAGCPGSDWPGWTEGPWSTAAPWTSWSGCSASTTATTVVTTTVSGSVTTATAFGVQVAQAEGTADTGTGTAAGSTGAAPVETAQVGFAVAVGAAVFGLAVGL
ncbi:hypothetical protein K458DRAFT_24904 [Lentithecium fluviatile CBS 122367]|uniref:Uncharacterized protein n=1 Tax=Lentithecium fluviatile CBS 122367 TaxID=1168545 RepID=A0A6G1J4L1_9PLEO|nr:hypothetical protein K458DRAFT_24904 [Lentithecium fluviatile CBS 122367]